jgi:hypothetical protein
LAVNKISGIRLANDHIQVSQHRLEIDQQSGQGSGDSTLRILDSPLLHTRQVNMPFLAVNLAGGVHWISGSFEADQLNEPGWLGKGGQTLETVVETAIVSLYPHKYEQGAFFESLCAAARCMDRQPFLFMSCSNSQLTFIVHQNACDRFITAMAEQFNLGPDFCPVVLQSDDQTRDFLKKRYPETKARYAEKKIKTYGIQRYENLNLTMAETVVGEFEAIVDSGPANDTSGQLFRYGCAFLTPSRRVAWSIVTPEKLSSRLLTPETTFETRIVDLLYLFGPHFGDRKGIASRLANCLIGEKIPFLQLGCTGAGITLITPEKKWKNS